MGEKLFKVNPELTRFQYGLISNDGHRWDFDLFIKNIFNEYIFFLTSLNCVGQQIKTTLIQFKQLVAKRLDQYRYARISLNPDELSRTYNFPIADMS